MNAPERVELFRLEEGQQKITHIEDEKRVNAATFTIQKEDHTVGNAIRMQLLKNSDVIYAGFKVPHPLETYVQVKVQTKKETTPQEAFRTALDQLAQQATDLLRKLPENPKQ